MARIPYVDPEEASPQVRETLEGMPAKLNIFRMMAHAERNFRPLVRLGGTILARQQLEGKLRELAILHVARLSNAEYEWVQHVPIARREGVRDAQIEAIAAGRVDGDAVDGDDGDVFDERERAVLAFTTELVRDVRPSDGVMDRMKSMFTPREIVEAVLAVGYYMMMARLMETTGVDLEEPAGDRLLASLS